MTEQNNLHNPLSSSLNDPAEKNKKGGIINMLTRYLGALLSSSSSSSTTTSMSSTRNLVGSTLFWIGFGLFGWYFPRFLMHRETSIVNKQPPYQISGEDTIIVDFELNHPLVDPPTVDGFLLRSTSVFFPFIFLVLHAWYSTPSSSLNSGTDHQNSNNRAQKVGTVISSFSAALGMSEGFTVMIKLWVQRRRPNFYELCGFNHTTKQCTANLKRIREANFSFPSGHSSLVCCAMTFLVWYLHGARKSSSTHHCHSRTNLWSRISSLIITYLPLAWALFVAASRLVDQWHHPSDVIAGLGLGFVTCTIAYHHWYPHIWSSNAGIPRGLLLKNNEYTEPSTMVVGPEISNISTTTTIPTTKRRQVQDQDIGNNNNNNNSSNYEIRTYEDLT